MDFEICDLITSSTTTVATTPATLSLPPKNNPRIIGYINKQGDNVRIRKPPNKISYLISKMRPAGIHKNPVHKMTDVLILSQDAFPPNVETVSKNRLFEVSGLLESTSFPHYEKVHRRLNVTLITMINLLRTKPIFKIFA